MYHIDGLCPRPEMGGCGFTIQLWPEFRVAVAKSGITQKMANTAITNLHRQWLDGCGYSAIYDPDDDPMEAWKLKHGLIDKRKFGPNARPFYDAHSIRVSWGEWGPEHITVPGNACGLDLNRSYVHDGMALFPHNVDTRDQAMLLLVVFTWFAGSVFLQSRKP